MKLTFGVLSLLIVLAIIGLSMKQQLRSSTHAVQVVAPAAPSSANVREQVRNTQEQFKVDVNKALQQGMTQRESQNP